jgi:predicted acylesterase/phospholipase RssA
MACKPFRIALAAALFVGAPLRGTPPSPVDCDVLLPLVLNVGVPESMVQAGENGKKLSEMQEAMRKLFQILQGTGVCPNRSLQVNLAIGNDYQVLDWLGRGAVDVGIVPDLSLHLLQERDRVDLLELDASSRLKDDILQFLPGETVRLRAWRAEPGHWGKLPETEPHLEQFRERLLRCAADPACEGGAERIGYRLALPSHLSPASREQVEKTAQWLEVRIGSQAPDLREAFWKRLFKTVRFTFGEAPPARPDIDPGMIEIEAFVQRNGDGPRPHLVFLAQSVAKVFRPGAFRKAQATIPERLQTLLNGSPSFAALRKAEPYFGVRRFVFTIPESLALLRQHQRTSGKSSLALVLPGGGVKSVYQSRLVDDLYRRRLLENVLIPGDDREPDHPLHVNYVMGTSGGALLGYFVARLGEKGPFDLTGLLWRGKDGEFLESTEVFPWTDMPRYVSLLVMLGLLAILLMLFSSIPFGKPLIPASEHPKRADWRLRLGLVFWPLMLMTPILVRRINGLSVQEHVPVIEGIFYTACTAMAVFADQCLALAERADAREAKTSSVSVSPWLPLSLGASLVGITFFGGSQSWLDLNVVSWQALVVIAILFFGVRYQLPVPRFRCNRDEIDPRARLAVASQDCAAVTFLSVGLLATGGSVLSRLDRIQIPDFILAFLALLFIVLAIPLLAARSVQPSGRRAWSGYLLMVLAVATAVVLFSRPGEASSFSDLFLRDSRLEIKVGSLLVCIGVLLLLSGVILWIARSRRYRIEDLGGFLSGLPICLLQIVLVSIVMWVLGEAWPARFPALELTWGFWKGLLAVSLAVGLLLVAASFSWRSSRRLGFLFKGLEYLCSHHQSGSLASRRILRIVGAASFAFVWWNFVLAPAFYGNGQARKFLEDVVVPRFQAEHRDLYGKGRFEELTAPLVVTANRLDTDGTRYFFVVPRAASACPPILQKPGSGAIWYSVLIPRKAGDPEIDAATCMNRLNVEPVERTSWQIQRYVFASGSPFPVFPAHRVPLSDLEGEKQADGKWPLVDGGYSNNVPVDGAVSLSAGQALILNSTPWDSGEVGGGARRWSRTLRQIPGPLVGDLFRLPGFLFERSQQIDRLRKQELFVVSFTPRYRKGWPGLTDFRENIIQDLKGYAEEDLEHRIGMVESWGPPSFQLSVLVSGGGGSPAS